MSWLAVLTHFPTETLRSWQKDLLRDPSDCSYSQSANVSTRALTEEQEQIVAGRLRGDYVNQGKWFRGKVLEILARRRWEQRQKEGITLNEATRALTTVSRGQNSAIQSRSTLAQGFDGMLSSLMEKTPSETAIERTAASGVGRFRGRIEEVLAVEFVGDPCCLHTLYDCYTIETGNCNSPTLFRKCIQ
jgi:hypothetical protein